MFIISKYSNHGGFIEHSFTYSSTKINIAYNHYHIIIFSDLLTLLPVTEDTDTTSTGNTKADDKQAGVTEVSLALEEHCNKSMHLV